MENRTHVGLDVHKETTAVAILGPGVSEPDHRVIPTRPEAYRKLVAGLRGHDVVFCYEAGPCGFDPYRLSALSASCDVIAPTLIPRRCGRRVKTDRIDARNLARLHRAGELVRVRVPSAAEEAVRDLIPGYRAAAPRRPDNGLGDQPRRVAPPKLRLFGREARPPSVAAASYTPTFRNVRGAAALRRSSARGIRSTRSSRRVLRARRSKTDRGSCERFC